jgi:hypothetical protein
VKLLHGAGGKLRGFNAAEMFDVTLSPFYTVAGGTSYDLQSQDALITHYDAAFADTNQELIFTQTVSGDTTITNLTPSIASISGTRVYRIVDGTFKLHVEHNGIKKLASGFLFRSQTASAIDIIKEFLAPSLARHMTDSIDTRINGVVSSTATRNLTTSTDQVTSMPRNPALWCADINMTPFALSSGSPAQVTNEGGNKSATVISKRHVISANHHKPVRAYWVDSTGAIIFRDIVSWTQVGITDIAIGTLSSDLPATITPVSFLPTTWPNHLPNAALGIPAAYLDSGGHSGPVSRQAGIGLCQLTALAFTVMVPLDVEQAAFYNSQTNPPILFRSGSPAYFIIEGKPVMIGFFTGANGQLSSFGDMISTYANEINAIMATETLSIVNLTNYPAY